MKKQWILFLTFLNLCTGIHAEHWITNPQRSDGFGAQFQAILYSVVYAELNGLGFRYTPFTGMEHNYDADPEFLKKKEDLINFIDHFEINKDPHLQPSMTYYHSFCESHWDDFAKSRSLQKIKMLFRSNKNKNDYFPDQAFHIAIHVRRPNPHDSRIEGTNTPDEIYLNIIHQLRSLYASKNPLFHIYSQGDESLFKPTFDAEDIILHLNGTVEETFPAFVLADALVTSRSSYSYTAALLSDGTVYYLPFWHPPLPHWIQII